MGVRNEVLLADVDDRGVDALKLAFLILNFHPGRYISLMLYHLQVVQLLILTIEILGCVIEYLHLVIHGMHLLISLLLQFAELDFIIKTSASAASSWVSRCLSLALHRLNDFPCLWIYFSEWIHAQSTASITAFAAWVNKIISAFT